MTCRKPIAIALLVSLISQESVAIGFFKRKKKCADALVPVVSQPREQAIVPVNDALEIIKAQTPLLIGTDKEPAWSKLINEYMLPFYRSRSRHLTISIVGPSNTGKSAIFNAIPSYAPSGGVYSEKQPRREISKVDFTAGRTQRPVILAHDDIARESRTLNQRFGRVEAWNDSMSAATAGPPVVYPLVNFFENLLFVDTPSFDMESQKPIADQVFNWSDLIFYVFSGSNYRNDLNLKIMKEKLEQLGARQVVLIYRVSKVIPEQEAFNHFNDVARTLYPDLPYDSKTNLPFPVLATYLMYESDDVASGKQDPVFKPMPGTEPFEQLLGRLNSDSDEFRKSALRGSLQYVLDGVGKAMNEHKRKVEEVTLGERAFKLFVNSTLEQQMQRISYDRIGHEIKDVLYSRAQGLNNIALWFAQPIRSLKGRKTEVDVTGMAMKEQKEIVNNVIDGTVTQAQLAAARNMVSIPIDDPDLPEFERDVEEFRQAFKPPQGESIYVKREGSVANIFLSRSPDQQRVLKAFQEQDWDEIKKQAKAEASDNLQNLTLNIQNQFKQLMRDAGFGLRTAHLTYNLMAVTPMFSTIIYFIWNGGNILDVKTIGLFVGSVVLARVFVGLDEKAMEKGMARAVDKWFREKQRRRLSEILTGRLKWRRPTTVVEAAPSQEPNFDDLEKALSAIGPHGAAGILPEAKTER